jgi:hypothetical protein
MNATGAAVIQAHAGSGGAGNALLMQANRQRYALHTNPIEGLLMATGLDGNIREGEGVHRKVIGCCRV